eukprot:1242079-Rhodomonas_salina.1
MEEMRVTTRKMERENMNERLEQVSEALLKQRFAVQKALGKMTAAWTLDILEQLVPVGLAFRHTA